MKKLFSTAIASVMAFSMISPVLAENQFGENNPKVFVNDREITFQDQLPVIDTAANRTLIPLRGVLEAMGAEVIWNGENKTVTINSKDNLTRLVLEIGNPIMKVYTAVSLVKYEEAEYEMDAAPIIVNDRTLIPLRAVGENMAADVNWDENTYTVTIKSKEYNKFIAKNTEANKGEDENYVYSLKDNLLNLSLSADKEDVNAGDEVAVYVKMTNTDKVGEVEVMGVTAALHYDSEKFTFEKAELIKNDKIVANVVGAANPEFLNDSVRTIMLVVPSADAEFEKITDSSVVKFTFKSVNGEEGEFKISDRKTTSSYVTGVILGVARDYKTYDDYTELYIDTTPVTVK